MHKSYATQWQKDKTNSTAASADHSATVVRR
jgi:hypothetical protein